MKTARFLLISVSVILLSGELCTCLPSVGAPNDMAYDLALDYLEDKKAIYITEKDELNNKILFLQDKLEKLYVERSYRGEKFENLFYKKSTELERRIGSVILSLDAVEARIDLIGAQIKEYQKQKILNQMSMKEEKIEIPALVPHIEADASRQQSQEVDAQQEYKIIPNDELQINVYGEPDLTKIMRVAADGTVSYPLIGRLKVVGLTAQGLEVRLAELLSSGGYIVSPQVSVYVERFNAVSVLGEVRNPGSYEFKGKSSILDAIAQAGGFNIDADINSVKILRTEDFQQKTIEVSLGDVKKGIEGAETSLRPNDTIFISKIGRIVVFGEVARPGTFELKGKMTALEAIALAGGFSDMADKDNLKILRIENEQQVTIQIRLGDIEEESENAELLLKPNDTIFVDKIGKVAVLGEVNQPGTFDLRDTVTVLESIAMAGGFTKVAAINSTRVIRKEGGIKKVIKIKVTDITRKGDMRKNIELKPGDVVYVPESLF